MSTFGNAVITIIIFGVAAPYWCCFSTDDEKFDYCDDEGQRGLEL
jgi:hypothetical protein